MRHLLTPIPDHPLAPWRALAKAAAAAGFPGENENASARLGTVGSLGFIDLGPAPEITLPIDDLSDEGS